MSTKNNPGQFDCYAKLLDDEPYFVLRGKDPHAPFLVDLWVSLRRALFGDYPKLDEATMVANEMRAWQAAHPDQKPTPPGELCAALDNEWLIWSEEHGAWWGPNQIGYTFKVAEAGRYPYDDAYRIVAAANRHTKSFKEAMVPWAALQKPQRT